MQGIISLSSDEMINLFLIPIWLNLLLIVLEFVQKPYLEPDPNYMIYCKDHTLNV